MAIRRVDPKATFRVVSQTDEAVETETAEEQAALKAAGQQTRYEKYLESFNLGDLKFKEGVKPTIFHIRSLLNGERADIDEDFLVVDTVSKTVDYKNQKKMLIAMFKLGCLGIEDDNGKLQPLDAESVEYSTSIDIGSLVSLSGTVGKNLKKA